MEWNWLLDAAEALAAPAGVAFLFWIGMRAVLRADQTERAAIARMEAEERAKGRPADPTPSRESSGSPGSPASTPEPAGHPDRRPSATDGA